MGRIRDLGNDAGWFHVLVVAIHTIVALLLALSARLLGLDRESSFLGGILFLVNSAHFQAVHWISAMDYPLALSFGLCAVVSFLYFLSHHKFAGLLVFYLTTILGVLTHPSTAVVWPFCLYLCWYKGYNLKTSLKSLLPLALLMIAELVLILSLTRQETSTWGSVYAYTELDISSLLAGNFRMLLWLASRLLTTAHWHLVTGYAVQTWELYLGAVILSGLVFLIWKRLFPGVLWSVWIILALLPFVALTEEFIRMPATGTSRYLYMANVGSSMLMAWGIKSASLYVAKKGAIWGKTAFGILFISVMASSYVTLKHSEALTFYVSGRSHIARGDVTTGISLLDRAVARSRDVIDLENTFERLCLMVAGRGEDIQTLLVEARKSYPENTTFLVYELATRSLSSDAKIRIQGRGDLLTLVADGRPLVREQIAQVYDSFGRGFRHKGVPQSAILMYRQALEFDPRRSKTMKSLAVVLLETGQHEEAMEWMQAIARLNPDDPFGLYAKALALRLEGKVDEAIIACNEALTSVQTAELFFLLGDCYEHEQMPDRALEAYRQSASLNPNNSGIFHHLGRVVLAQGDTVSAIEAFERAAQLESQDVNIYLILGRLYKENGQLERAQEIYSTALDGNFQGVGSPVYLRLGMDFEAWGRFEDAVRAYEKAIDSNQSNVVAHTNLGWIYLLQERFDDAIDEFRVALELESNSYAFFNLGLAYLAQGKTKQAELIYKDAVLQFGAEEAVRIGAVDDLRNPIGRGIRVAAAEAILNSHWPEP